MQAGAVFFFTTGNSGASSGIMGKWKNQRLLMRGESHERVKIARGSVYKVAVMSVKAAFIWLKLNNRKFEIKLLVNRGLWIVVSVCCTASVKLLGTNLYQIRNKLLVKVTV